MARDLLSSPRLAPLSAGTVVDDRFHVVRVLRQRLEGWEYEAVDKRLGAPCALLEFSAAACGRTDSGALSWGALPRATSHRYTWDAYEVFRASRRVNGPGLMLPYHATFDLGTVFWATECPPSVESLLTRLQAGRPLHPRQARAFFEELLERIGRLHTAGMRHGHLSWDTIHLSARGEVVVSHPGTPVEWLLDATRANPWLEFSAPEQRTARGRRGPWSDLFNAACAVWFACDVGLPPEDESQRALGALLFDVDRDLSDCLAACLREDPLRRPQTVHDALELLRHPERPATAVLGWQELEEQLVAARKLRPGRRECPGCGGVIKVATMAPDQTCLQGRGKIQHREFSERGCPICKVGVLKKIENTTPLRFCPDCRTGWLWSGLIKAPWSPKIFSCEACKAEYGERGGVVTPKDGEPTTWDSLRNRSVEVHACDQCSAQLDALPDGRWALVQPDRSPEGYSVLYPDEWGRVAAHLPPSAGNATGDKLDYHLDPGGLTLLGDANHPWHGVWLDHERARWIAGGKTSGEPGLLCEDCALELDVADDNAWKLVYEGAKGSRLRDLRGEAMTMGDWHSAGKGLPRASLVPLMQQLLEEQLVGAWIAGDIGGEPFWEGEVTSEEGHRGRLSLWRKGIRFERGLRKKRVRWDGIRQVFGIGRDQIVFELVDETRLGFTLAPTQLGVNLRSGYREIRLTAADVVDRCRTYL